MADKTIYQHLLSRGFSRRDFVRFCGVLGGVLGFGTAASGQAGVGSNPTRVVARALVAKSRVPLIWLEFQDCAGCTESLTRSSSPTLVELVLNTLTIEYQETLAAASGHQLEEAKTDAMTKYRGQYLLVVEGSVPADGFGEYCFVAGRPAAELLREAASGAAAVIAIGNCATFGGIPRAQPNPTVARAVSEMLPNTPVVNVSGCPPIPEVFTATLVHFVVFGRLPELDHMNRPRAFYGNTIHDRCLRRPFYERGRFAGSFDDHGARQGWCLYKLGCKGPTTYNACASLKWQQGLSFPIESGHPCFGCSEPQFWDRGGLYQGQSAPIDKPRLAVAGAAIAVGAVAGSGVAASARLQKRKVEAR